MQQSSPFGIYLNLQQRKVVRINSPYWIPAEPDWIFLTPQVNATLLQIRQMVQEQKLVEDWDSVTWGSLPSRD